MNAALSAPVILGGLPTNWPWSNGRGTIFFVDPVNGSDAYDGLAGAGPEQYQANPTSIGSSTHGPKKTIKAAYDETVDGRGDVVVLLAYDSSSAATARIASGGLTWANDNTHLIGIGAPTIVSKRPRIAATSTLDATTTPTLITISGSNCIFQNLQFFHGVAGDADSFAVKITGQRCYFENVHFAGIAHATAAARAGSRSVTIDGGSGTFLGEHTFVNCLFGVTTIAQAAANAQLEFLNFTARNHFKGCKFIGLCPTGTTTGLFVKAAASSIQDYVEFENCVFASLTKQSGAAGRANAMNIASDSGGDVWLTGTSAVYGCTDIDAASSSNVWVATPVPTAGTSSVAVVATH